MSQLTSRGYLPKPPASLKLRTCLLCVNMFTCIYTHLLFAYMYITSWHHTIAFSITISRISRVLLMQGHVELDVYQEARGFSSKQSSPVKFQVQQLESVAMTHSTWWAWFSWKDIHRCKGLPSKEQSSTSNIFLCLPPRDPWKHASTYHALHFDNLSFFRFPYSPAVYFSKRWL